METGIKKAVHRREGHRNAAYLQRLCEAERLVAVVRLKYPISWTPNEKVRLMFLIAIDFETSEEILRFFQYFYGMIGNKELIGHLLDAEGPKEFYEILMSEAG